MNLIPTSLPGAVVLESKVFSDSRGFFTESYNKQTLESVGINIDFVQDNHSLSVPAGTVRGLHYQLAPMAQTKLVRVLTGAIYDVIVDIRRDSETFGKWEGFILTADSHRQLLVPQGFAHGFCTLVANTQVFYKVDNYYSAENDRGIRWDDPELAIPWPTQSPVLSDKDAKHPFFHDAEMNF